MKAPTDEKKQQQGKKRKTLFAWDIVTFASRLPGGIVKISFYEEPELIKSDTKIELKAIK